MQELVPQFFPSFAMADFEEASVSAFRRVFCFEKNCTLHCNVIYFQTIYILSSNFMSVIFMSVNFMSVIFSQPLYEPVLNMNVRSLYAISSPTDDDRPMVVINPAVDRI